MNETTNRCVVDAQKTVNLTGQLIGHIESVDV